jgi:hypothetical protein
MDPVRTGSLGTIRILVPEEWVPVAAKLISHRTPTRPRQPGARVIDVDFRQRRRASRSLRGSRPTEP